MKQQLTICLGALAISFAFSANASAILYTTISIDGDTSDWAGVPIAASDADDNGTAGAVDWKDIYIANDANFLYVRVTLWEPADAGTSVSNYYVDGDNDDSTGYHVFGDLDFGSSLLMQAGGAFQQAGSAFNEGGLAGSAVSFAGSGADYEFRVDRNVVGVAGAFIGAPLFTSSTIQLQLQTGSGLGDLATDGITGIEYTLVSVPEPSPFLLMLLVSIGLVGQSTRKKFRA